LLDRDCDPRHWFVNPPPGTPPLLKHYLRRPDWRAADADLQWFAGGSNRRLVTIDHPDYPPLLRQTPDPPVALFALGTLEALQLPQIAMVGSRNPTAGGWRSAHQFAHEFASCGLAITSGLALGIDGASHQGALDANAPTIAVAATGLDRVYPARHRDMAHQISAQHGVLVSEFPLGTSPRPGLFPRRNRIISGLAVGTLVVEAALRSGSLITARQALEQGREVFAIPGSIHNPLARGCHALIRDGAKLVECAQDVLEELAALLGRLVREPPSPNCVATSTVEANPEHQQLLDAMGFDPISIDELAIRLNESAEAVASTLLLLELEGHVSSGAGGLFTRQGKPQS
jgi:DNA processing protein